MGPFISDRINPLGYDEGSGIKCCDCQEVSGVNLCFVLTVESVEEYLLSPLVAFIAFSCAPGAHVLLHNQGRLLDEFRASLYALANSQQFIYIVGTFRIMPVSPAGDIKCSATARGQRHTCQRLLKDNPVYLFPRICGSSEVGPTLGSIPKLKVLFSFFLRSEQFTAKHSMLSYSFCKELAVLFTCFLHKSFRLLDSPANFGKKRSLKAQE